MTSYPIFGGILIFAAVLLGCRSFNVSGPGALFLAFMLNAFPFVIAVIGFLLMRGW